jgi:CheY-like chemotaxis protein
MGHNVKLAYEGKSAIEAAKEFRPELVFLDIGMPGMNGYEICRTLRQDDAFKKTVIVAQTGWGQEEHRKRSREAGFDHHLVKPVHYEALGKIIDSLPH